LATQRGRGGEVKSVPGGDQFVRLDVYDDRVTVGGAQDVVWDMRLADIITRAELDFERLRRDTNNPWVEVEGDEMVTLTSGLNRP
jgi:hypothetical protein